MGKLIDLTGQRFGRLTVIERAGTQCGHVMWRCVCDCGNQVLSPSGDLRKGKTKSCGCAKKKRAASMAKMGGEARGDQMRKTRPQRYKTIQHMESDA